MVSFRKFPPWKPLVFSGLLLLAVGLVLLAGIYFPLISQEVSYDLKHSPLVSKIYTPAKPGEVVPPDPDFSIYIPKISALAPVVSGVDPYNSREYQKRLTLGVAHAKGSAYPGSQGNVFLFAHSAGNPLEASRFNAVFYLLSKLESGDSIFLWYSGVQYPYRVVEKKIVSPSTVNYLSAGSDRPSLVLMTCWPPGTTLKRLLILAEPIPII